MGPGTSEGNADAAHGVRYHEGRWKPRGCDDLAVTIYIRLLLSFRMEVHQAMSTLHALEGGGESPRTTGRDVARDETWRGFAFDYLYVGDSGPLGKDGLDVCHKHMTNQLD